MIGIKTNTNNTAFLKPVFTGLFKILPYWLTAVSLVCAFILVIPLISKLPVAEGENLDPLRPQVLGDYTEIRGSSEAANIQESSKKLILNEDKINAESFLVADVKTGEVLAEKDSSKQRSIASLTKLMTGLVAYTQNILKKEVVVEKEDHLNVSPVLGLREGDTVLAQDLFNAMIVGSANDAAQTLANFTSRTTGKNFTDLMNETARVLGMTETSFSNPLGFEKTGNYSTAQDILKLVIATQRFSTFTELGKNTEYDFTGSQRTYHIRATNKLIGRYADVEGVKTGFTEQAGETMVTKITRNGKSVYIIVLGSNNREKDTMEIAKQVLGE